ncbi:centrosomal protein of 19 kDa-like [Lycorma delicatula]|uniref:centrosomal protein of 19 kDa-like n=1 Tax=Lycorma delicatula TaxID=130591 RepID=UPI003F51520D
MAAEIKETDIVPHKCGIVLTPPAVLYIYENKITKKIRKLLMPVQSSILLSDTFNSDADFLAADLKMRHKPLLDLVDVNIIKKMIFLLHQHKKGQTVNDALLQFNDKENYTKIVGSQNLLSSKTDKQSEKSDVEDDLGDTDFDDLDAPIDKLGIYSEDEGDAFWK